jgi:hypothetical protein
MRRRYDVGQGSASSGLSGRGAVNAATQDVETPDPVGLFTELEREQSGTGRHVGGHVAALGRSREHRYRGDLHTISLAAAERRSDLQGTAEAVR